VERTAIRVVVAAAWLYLASECVVWWYPHYQGEHPGALAVHDLFNRALLGWQSELGVLSGVLAFSLTSVARGVAPGPTRSRLVLELALGLLLFTGIHLYVLFGSSSPEHVGLGAVIGAVAALAAAAFGLIGATAGLGETLPRLLRIDRL
jgi:hypothetical protein